MVTKTKTEVLEVKPINVKMPKIAEKKALKTLATAKEIVIKSQEQYEYCADCLKEVKAQAREIEAERKKITVPLDNVKKAVQALFNRPKELYAEAEGILKRGMIAYNNEQERIRREKERKLQAEEDRRAEKERKRLEKKAEKEAAKGNEEKAEELREEAEEVEAEAPILAPTVSKPAGVIYKKNWSAVVMDFSLVPDEYKLPNMPKLNGMAKITKGESSIPGVEFKSTDAIASR